MSVAIAEDLEVVEEFSVDKVHEVKKEFILTDFWSTLAQPSSAQPNSTERGLR